MNLTAPGRHTLLLLTLTMAATPALAQVPAEPSRSPAAASDVEITPFVSLGSPMSSRIGATIRFALTPSLSLESETGYRRQEIGAVSTHLSLLYHLPRVGLFRPYVAAGIGLEEYGTALLLPGLGVVRQERIAFTINAGGGLDVPVSERLSMRADARWFNGLGRSAGEHWRVFNGVTLRPRAR